MGSTVTALILICSAALAIPDCNIDNATDVVQGPDVNSIYGCGLASQAMIASTALGPGLGKDQYLKIVCTRKERLQLAEPVDRDQDGFVTLDEVAGYEAKLFERIDSQGTGRLTVDQYCGGIPPANTVRLSRCRMRFARMDANDDSYITLDEIQDFYRLVLQRADRDNDGKVSLYEWLVATAEN